MWGAGMKASRDTDSESLEPQLFQKQRGRWEPRAQAAPCPQQCGHHARGWVCGLCLLISEPDCVSPHPGDLTYQVCPHSWAESSWGLEAGDLLHTWPVWPRRAGRMCTLQGCARQGRAEGNAGPHTWDSRQGTAHMGHGAAHMGQHTQDGAHGIGGSTWDSAHRTSS